MFGACSMDYPFLVFAYRLLDQEDDGPGIEPLYYRGFRQIQHISLGQLTIHPSLLPVKNYVF